MFSALRSRRAALGEFVGAAGALLTLARFEVGLAAEGEVDLEDCRLSNDECTRDSQCCSLVCTGRKRRNRRNGRNGGGRNGRRNRRDQRTGNCRCKRFGTSCRNTAACCNGTCDPVSLTCTCVTRNNVCRTDQDCCDNFCDGGLCR
jgi:hypothetical protein